MNVLITIPIFILLFKVINQIEINIMLTIIAAVCNPHDTVITIDALIGG